MQCGRVFWFPPFCHLEFSRVIWLLKQAVISVANFVTICVAIFATSWALGWKNNKILNRIGSLNKMCNFKPKLCYLTPIAPNWLGRQLRLVEHFRRGSQPANLAVGASIQKLIKQYWKQKSTIHYTTSSIKYWTRIYIWTDDLPFSPSQHMCFRNTEQYFGAPTSCTANTLPDPF